MTRPSKQTLGARAQILAELARRPDDLRLQADLCVACGRLVDMRLALADTLGAVEECATNLRLAESFFRTDPRDPEGRRAVLIACAKMAGLRAMQGDRDSAEASYRRAERLALEAVATLPNNTDASRDLSIVYGMHGLFLAEGGDLDSALAVYDHGMRIAEELAAADPDNALQQSDVAAGHYEIGTMLVKRALPGRAAAVLARRSSAMRASRPRTPRTPTAGCSWRAVAAGWERPAGRCRFGPIRVSNEAPAVATLTWLQQSLELYRSLGRSGALTGEEAAAPEELDRLVAALRKEG